MTRPRPGEPVVLPPIPYFGGKQALAPWIVSLLPDHGHYVEPYGGSLAVLLAKIPARMETVNDIDGELMTFWRVLRTRPIDLARVCALTPHSRAELLAAREASTDELETARRVWVRLTQSPGRTLRKNGWRRRVDPGGAAIPRYLERYVERMPSAAERLKTVSLECAPALDLIATYGRNPRVLLYVDPPYLGDTRAPGSRYRREMRGAGEHRELAAALADCRAAVVLSGYHSPLYDELYAGWHTYERRTTTGNAVGDKSRIEVVWSNRPLTPGGGAKS
jgi:DNA adenine methylase